MTLMVMMIGVYVRNLMDYGDDDGDEDHVVGDYHDCVTGDVWGGGMPTASEDHR